MCPARAMALSLRSANSAVMVASALAAGVLSGCVGAAAQQTPPDVEWRQYAADSANTRYSPLDHVTKENLQRLGVSWRWSSADRSIQAENPVWRASRNEDTPLFVNGTLYTVTQLGLVAALDPGTGETRWVYDPESYKDPALRPSNVGYLNRGMAFWTGDGKSRLFVGTPDGYLMSIDTSTGKPDPMFGNAGKADLTADVPRAKRMFNLVGRRPLVAGDIVVAATTVPAVGSHFDVEPPGYVHAFDVRTGRKLWTFHTVPLPGEVGYETWLEGSAGYSGNTNVWGGMAYDPVLGYVYMASATPTNDFYGGHRPGDNLFAESLICVEAKTGRRVWHFQAVHHGVWDYDFPAPPVLGEIVVDGRRIDAVMQVSKQAFTYVFDRKSGKPVWPIPEKPVPQSTVPRERTAPTQPFPSRPPAFDLQGTGEENVIAFTPELKKRALAELRKFDHGPMFTPPSVKGTVMLPGVYGGANWGGAGFDPVTKMLYVPSRMYPFLARLAPGEPSRTNFLFRSGGSGPTLEDSTVDGLPIFKPPYSRVTAIDMNKGDIRWMSPIGNGPRQHPLLKDLRLGPLGDQIHGGSVLITKSLLFVGVTHVMFSGFQSPPAWARWGDSNAEQKVIYVFDKLSGALLRVIELDGRSVAAPMTYLYRGKQYLVVAAGGGQASELVAFVVQ